MNLQRDILFNMYEKHKESVYDISYKVYKVFYRDSNSKQDKSTVFKAIQRALKNGWATQEIYSELRKYKGKKVLPNFNNMFKKKMYKNLLSNGEVYYHNVLRIVPPVPELNWDPVTGAVSDLEYDFYLEYRASFTVEELADYYMSKPELNNNHVRKEQIEGALKWMVDKYSIDLMLFLIDATVDVIKDKDLPPPNSPLKIQDNIRYACDKRNKKIDEVMLNTGNTVIPKNRRKDER